MCSAQWGGGGGWRVRHVNSKKWKYPAAALPEYSFIFLWKKRDRNRVDSDEDSRSGTGRPLDGAAFRIGKWSRCCAPCPHSCTTLNLKLSMRPTFRPMRNWEESPKLVRWLLRSVDSRVTRFRRWPVKSTVSFFFLKIFLFFFLRKTGSRTLMCFHLAARSRHGAHEKFLAFFLFLFLFLLWCDH